MQDHFASIEVHPDCECKQLYSCVANGGLHNESDILVLAMALNGADSTKSLAQCGWSLSIVPITVSLQEIPLTSGMDMIFRIQRRRPCWSRG